MTDHLADARACLSRVDQAAAHFSAVSWLTCEQIIEQAARAAIAAAEPHIRAETLAPIRAALADHPRCDIHPDDDPIKCGWKRAVADIQAALDREEQP